MAQKNRPATFGEQSAKKIVKATKIVLGQGGGAGRGNIGGGGRDYFYAKAFIITDIGDDILICTQVSSTEENITVAKPWLLRVSPFDGAIYNGFSYVYSDEQTRVSTSVADASTENQLVTPSYVVGDEIIAFIVGGLTLDMEDGDDVRWIDLNVDGRAFAKEA